MNTDLSTNRFAETSPQTKARITGIFYPLTMLAGMFARIFVSDGLIVSGNAATTAANILNNESLFRLGFAVYLVEMACRITMTALFYDLLKR